jgi:hypothetical protein
VVRVKWHAESGLWTTGPEPAPPPLTAVLEVSGAVFSWTVDDVAGEPQIVVTDLDRADWLWRLVGGQGHDTLAAALLVGDGAATVEVPGVEISPAALAPLRRLAVGHWLRRWWPASRRDGIADLDADLLDGELAVLTAAAHEFFDDDAFDADVADLLGAHIGPLEAAVEHHDSRVSALARACVELAEDSGVPVAVAAEPARRRDDYALAAAGPTDSAVGAIARGRSSVQWSAVPPGIFDAAEDTIDWAVRADDGRVSAVVTADIWGAQSPAGIAVRIRAGGVDGAGSLDPEGHATVALFDGAAAATEDAAWGHDWSAASVLVGADVAETRQARERARAFARQRLSGPAADAYLAEILAAEADY